MEYQLVSVEERKELENHLTTTEVLIVIDKNILGAKPVEANSMRCRIFTQTVSMQGNINYK